ncbi:MAG TPA: TonB-dependent receptor [Flavisolibacter sp.]|nr:TonB-dependent receptor [Flavisolibacter sp.]
MASGQCVIRLSGHVHSTMTHENLAGAVVTLNGKPLVTNANGDFRFEAMCAGTYVLTVSHASYDSLSRTLSLDKNTHLDLDLVPRGQPLTEITVTGLRTPPASGDRKELSGRELDETRGGSLAEALSKINGVSMLQTGATISKPVIHGLHGMRILTINNGVRQEGQQWGNEHAPEIDPFIADKLTVIKGVDELRYGSDAIGGVILVEPRPLRHVAGYSAELNSVYSTNNRQYVVSGVFEQQLKKLPSFSYRLQGTFKKGANTATPDYRLNNTALEEKNASFTAGWRREHFRSELYYSLFATKVGIFSGSHIGNLTDLQTAIASSRPDPVFTGDNSYRIDRPYQEANHHLLKWKTSFDAGNSRFNLLLAGQYNNRKEYDVVRNAAARGAQLDLSIYTLSEELNWEHPKKNNFSGTIGINAMQQDNSYSGRYLIPNYRSYSYGAYGIEKWAKGQWDVQAGIRVDAKEIQTTRLRAGTGVRSAYNFDFTTLASSVNAGYKLMPGWKINGGVSLSTRAPHVNELLIDGIHHGTGTYERGNIDLKPERSVNLSLTSNYTSRNKFLDLQLTLYRNRIENFIYQQPRPDSPVLTIRGAFPLIEYTSTDALLQGFDASASIHPSSSLSYTARYALLRARNLRSSDWLIWMPADRITNEISYQLKDRKRFTATYLSLELSTVLKQTRTPDESNGKQDYKAPPAGYTLLNADLSTTISIGKLPLTVGLSGRNLLNNTYREYLNTFRYYADERGRNISLRLKFALQHIY